MSLGQVDKTSNIEPKSVFAVCRVRSSIEDLRTQGQQFRELALYLPSCKPVVLAVIPETSDNV